MALYESEHTKFMREWMKQHPEELLEQKKGCLLYTSDAADERSSVDLGGRRIIKKKRTYSRKMRYIIITKY